MRIAMVAPLTEPVPPPLTAAPSGSSSLLTEELVRRGHEVTLFASGDSQTARRAGSLSRPGAAARPGRPRLPRLHDAPARRGLRAGGRVRPHPQPPRLLRLPFARLSPTPTLTTTHGRLDLPDLPPRLRRLPRAAPRLDQRRPAAPFPAATGWRPSTMASTSTLPLPRRPRRLPRLPRTDRPGEATGPGHRDRARRRACALVIAAKVDPVDQDYWEHAIEPLIGGHPGLIEYVGEVDEHEKDALLGGAYAYLFPIDWPEPFGLTMAEAMATGTPVVASRAGVVPEVVEDGVTGFVCDTSPRWSAAIRGSGSSTAAPAARGPSGFLARGDGRRLRASLRVPARHTPTRDRRPPRYSGTAGCVRRRRLVSAGGRSSGVGIVIPGSTRPRRRGRSKRRCAKTRTIGRAVGGARATFPTSARSARSQTLGKCKGWLEPGRPRHQAGGRPRQLTSAPPRGRTAASGRQRPSARTWAAAPAGHDSHSKPAALRSNGHGLCISPMATHPRRRAARGTNR